MKKLLAVLGLLCAVAPLAHATDIGVVTRFEGNNVTFHTGLLALRVGEIVRLQVIPQRSEATGQGVVTDIDDRTHRVAVALLPLGGAAVDTTAVPAVVHGGIRLYRDDTVRMLSTHRFMDNVPEYRIERAAFAPSPATVDIEMPAGATILRPRINLSNPAAVPLASPEPEARVKSRSAQTHKGDAARPHARLARR
ncbi:MAG: hypothetical protein KY468_19205 [Armatimonadetes bacterium]|nr:hypothetical protein [Armatimonadota bacterium]